MYGLRPYSYHLGQVADVALRFGFATREVDMLCWAHDVLEDTGETRDSMLQAGFPIDVVDAVEALSDKEGANRRERKANALTKMKKNRLSRIGKLCDRIANVEESRRTNSSLLRMYQKEHASFRAALFDAADAELLNLWQHLDRLIEI